MSIAVAGVVAALCAASLFATVGDEDAEVVEAGAESSAPQPLNVNVASATKAALARRLSLLMSASSFVKADAVSNPFKK
ncbi:MAG TPA: hypothetical protein VEN30_27875 [Paraburkholderia sp.]|nr:hypothetical protein [Paraburkholderia sp.]